MLKIGNKHTLHSFVEESKVTFNVITPNLMDRYLATKDSLDKAGAYGIQGPSLTFISKVEGDYANVVGFPLSRFVLECEQLLKPFSNGQSWFDLF
jgi:septum formation protein